MRLLCNYEKDFTLYAAYTFFRRSSPRFLACIICPLNVQMLARYRQKDTLPVVLPYVQGQLHSKCHYGLSKCLLTLLPLCFCRHPD
jgi:hypothetical protein